MRLALLGHGAMGQLVERLAREAGDEVATVLGSREAAFGAEELAEILGGHDAAIDFTVAEAVPRHAEACALARVPLVEGTTGWHAQLDEVRQVFEREVVRFTTDIPYLPSWGAPLLVGPGSILDAHTDGERVSKRELEEAVEIYARLARSLLARS